MVGLGIVSTVLYGTTSALPIAVSRLSVPPVVGFRFRLLVEGILFLTAWEV